MDWYYVAVTDNIMVIYRNTNHIIMLADSVASISSFEYLSTVSYLDIRFNKLSPNSEVMFRCPRKKEMFSRVT